MKDLKSNNLPSFIYGTAWKEDRTKDLVKKAVSVGFKAIDTANQRKHYNEPLVGEALVELSKQGIKRETLFLQTKFTFLAGQDHRLPYNPKDSFEKQVKSSFESSLKNLHTDYLDSFLLHGPSSYPSLYEADFEVWQTMQDLQKSGKVKMLGISNVNIDQLHDLVGNSKIKPAFVQNRCYADRGWDKEVREYCLANEIVYQGFSLLTANPQIIGSSVFREIAKKLNATPQQIVFSFCRKIGILPLTGTTDERHMKEDLDSFKIKIDDEDVEEIRAI